MPHVTPEPDELVAMLRDCGYDVQAEVDTIAIVLGNLRSCYGELSGG